jgi:hypothetical protein
MSDQQGERRRSYPLDFPGMTDGPGPVGAQLVPGLVGQADNCRIIQIIWQRESFVTPISGDIGSLTLQVDVVFGVDLELLGHFRRQRPEPRPDP